jgi:prevent-host-death family protein
MKTTIERADAWLAQANAPQLSRAMLHAPSGLERTYTNDHTSQMTTVSISELKARLSAFIDIVRDGDEVLVTDRGRLIARLMPIRQAEQEEGRREMLLRSGRLRGPTATLADDFFLRARPADANGDSLAALLDERADGR